MVKGVLQVRFAAGGVSMKFDLSAVFDNPGERVAFDYEIDLSDLELNYSFPFAEPVRLAGEVKNSAGVLAVEGAASSNLHLSCDRCTRKFERTGEFYVDRVIVRSLSNPDDPQNDDIILIESGELELDEIFIQEIILGFDMKTLCSEHCRGICPRCGTNLNDGECGCGGEADPRLDILKKLLD